MSISEKRKDTASLMKTAVSISGILCVVIVGYNFAQVFGPSTFRPVVSCSQPNVEYEYSYEGEQLPHTFQVENIGGRPLVISDVTTSCDCSEVEPISFPVTVNPGENFPVTITFDTTDKGTTFKSAEIVFVHTNDLQTPQLQLTITAIPKKDE